MADITEEQALAIYRLIESRTSARPFRLNGAFRIAEDGEEALQEIFLRIFQRAKKRWDPSRPLVHYVSAAIPHELRKFRGRQGCQEIPQSKGPSNET